MAKTDMLFMECSAKSGINVEAVFMVLVETILNKIKRGEIDPNNENQGVKVGSFMQSIVAEDFKRKCC
jgi:hypothetical protein